MSLRNKVLLVALLPLIVGVVTVLLMSSYFKGQARKLLEKENAIFKATIVDFYLQNEINIIKEFGSNQLTNTELINNFKSDKYKLVKENMNEARMLHAEEIAFWVMENSVTGKKVMVPQDKKQGEAASAAFSNIGNNKCIQELISKQGSGVCFHTTNDYASLVAFQTIIDANGIKVGNNYVGYDLNGLLKKVKEQTQTQVGFVTANKLYAKTNNKFAYFNSGLTIDKDFGYSTKEIDDSTYQFKFIKTKHEKMYFDGYFVFGSDASDKAKLDRTQIIITIIIFVSILVLGVICAFVISKSVTDPMIGISRELLTNQDDLSKITEQLGTSSGELSSTSTEQASATQESVAAMEEMKSMIGHTHEYARNSQATTNSVSTKATEGNTIMEELSRSMEGIERANQDMTNMSVIIEDIRKKTDIINEIVFKTQLLSFNASIEAARAGQHGKGFAVVAEEVGNLAKMSGDAAQEIALLLDNSNKEVNKIIESTKTTVESGIKTTQSALDIFNQIKNDVIQVDGQVKGIVQASNEQQEGVVQTSKALAQLGDAATNNNNLAIKTMDNVATLKELREQVKFNILELVNIISKTGVKNNNKVNTVKKVLKESEIPEDALDNIDDNDFDQNFERLG